MATKPENAMTYGQLRDALMALSPEQLAMPVIWSGDERGGYVEMVHIAAEDLVCPDDDGHAIPRSELLANPDEYDLTPAQAELEPVVVSKGHVILVVD